MKTLRIFLFSLFLTAIFAHSSFASISVTVNITPPAVYNYKFTVYLDGAFYLESSTGITNVNGTQLWSILSTPGNYTFKISEVSPGYLPGWADNKANTASATVFPLVNWDARNIYFGGGYTISGNVKNRAGTNLANKEVHIYDSSYNWLTKTTTDTNGNYTFKNAYNGNYLVQAQDPSGSYFSQYYSNAFGYGDLASVNVSGANRTGVTFSLYELVTVNGTVSDHAGAGIQDVWVYAFENAAGYRYLNKVTTNASGVYRLPVPASMNVIVKYEKANYFDYYYGSYDRAQAANFYLSPLTTSNNINATLQRISTINGTVSSNTGTLLTGAEVFAFLQSGSFIYVNKTATSGGAYTLTVPSSTNIMLRASANGYMTVFYKQQYAQPTSTTINLSTTTTNNIDFMLAPGRTIQGRVTVYGGSGTTVTVNVEDVNGTYFTSTTYDASAGYCDYSFSSVPAGLWKVKGIKTGCISEYYGNTASTLDATTVDVTLGNASGLNFDIAPSWSISGTVNVLGQPTTYLSGVRIVAFRYAAGWHYIDEATTDAQGKYTINSGYNTGNVFVKATRAGYQDLLYNDKEGDWTSADPFMMVPTQATQNVNFSMYNLGTITGTITDTLSGSGLAGVTISAFTYDSGWNYVASTLSITGGTYTLFVRPAQNLKIKAEKFNYIPELYNNIQNTSSWNLATTVNVSSGGTSSNISFGLDPFWTITGNASPAGTLVEVFGYNNWQEYIGDYTVTAAGTYAISGTGNARNIMVRFSYDAGNYVRILYPTLNCFSDISVDNRLTVTAGNSYGLSPVVLAQGGTIQGTVTAYGGTGVVTVNIEYTGGKYFTDVTANAATGTYAAPRIPAGQWKVKARKLGCISEYYGETASTANATTVNLTAGGTASGINIEIAPSWSITGTVNIAGTSTPIQGALIQVFKYQAGWLFVAEATSNASGRYTIVDGYNTGNIFLKASRAGYVEQLYNDKTGDWTAADPLYLAPLAATANIDFPLYSMATASGTVRSVTGAVLAGVTISVYKVSDNSLVATGNTNGSGVYSVSVLPRIPLRIVAAKNHFLTTAYGPTVNVASGSTSSNLDITLEQSWRVAGMVYGSGGGIVAGALVRMCLETSPDVTLFTAYANTSGYYELASSQDVTASVLLRCSATGYTETISSTLNVALGYTDITTFSITLESTVVHVTSIADTIKSGPNPCNPDEGPVHIGFKVNEPGTARIRIFTVGRELVYDESIQCVAGYNEVQWEADNLYNESLPNGMYLAYVEVDSDGKKVKKVLKIAILR